MHSYLNLEVSIDTYTYFSLVCLFYGFLRSILAVFQKISRRSVLLVEKPEYPEKTTDLGQAIGKLYHVQLLQSNTPFL